MVFLFRRQPSSLDRTSDFESDFLANNTRKKNSLPMDLEEYWFCKWKEDGREARAAGPAEQ